MIPAYDRPPTLNKVFISFHISAVIYFMVGLCFCVVPPVALYYGASMGPAEVFILMAIGGFSVLMGVAVELLIWQLKMGKNWAWIVGLCVAGI